MSVILALIAWPFVRLAEFSRRHQYRERIIVASIQLPHWLPGSPERVDVYRDVEFCSSATCRCSRPKRSAPPLAIVRGGRTR